MTGHRFLREYPYHGAYLLADARLFRAELSKPLILLGGITVDGSSRSACTHCNLCMPTI